MKNPPEATEAPSVEDVPVQPPRWRGRLHQVAFIVSIPAGYALVATAPTLKARFAAMVYALSLAGLFGVSAAYHRYPWSPKGKRRMRRLDHSMIFVLIAGTYTPMALLVLKGPWSVVLLSVVWGVAALGIVLKIVRIDGLAALGGTLYIVLGWMAVVAAPQMVQGLTGVQIALILIGGILYTGGAIILATNRPNPSPRVFGYHEIWHSFTIGAAACHFTAVMMFTLAAR